MIISSKNRSSSAVKNRLQKSAAANTGAADDTTVRWKQVEADFFL